MAEIQLSSRRELVEKLDSAPLFEYLIQHGALDTAAADKIKQATSDAKINLALLQHLENNNKSVPLFLNGLRHTGQHQLANLLDESQRIQPSSSPGYLRKGRHKGQVGILISVKAVKLSKSSLPSSVKEWINLDEIIVTVPPSAIRRHSIEQMDILESCDTNSRKSSPSLCGCFPRIFSKKQAKKEKSSPRDSFQNGGPATRSDSIAHVNTPNQQQQVTATVPHEGLSKSEKHEAARKEKMAVFNEKACAYYNFIQDGFSNTKTSMLKYFEQERGTLVLNIGRGSSGKCVEINIILMLEEHVAMLKKAYQSGQLLNDLEKCLVTTEALNKIDAKGLKLLVELNQDDLYLAENEFFP